MITSVYDQAVNIIGFLPYNYHFIYAIGAIMLLCVIMFILIAPIVFLLSMIRGR